MTSRNISLFLLLLTFSLPGLFAQKAEHPGFEINTAYEEREPIPNYDGSTLFFWRRENPNNTAGITDPGDIWMGRKNRDGTWQRASRMDIPLNSRGHDFVWQISPDEDTLWVNQNPPGVRGVGIAYSTRTASGNWTTPTPAHIRNFEYKGNYKDYFLTRNHFLLLPNEGDGSYGGTDIYVCFPINDTAWSEPINLGPTINTSGDDDAPYLAPDGVTLYFNSDGHGGHGDHDVFVSKRLDNSWRNWSTPENIGAPINSKGYDFDFMLSGDGKTAFWCSDLGTYGSNDIFTMDMESCQLDVYPEGDHTICQGTRFELEAGFTTGRNIEFQWIKNGSPIRGAIARKLMLTESGDFQLKRIVDGCESTSPVQRIRFVPAPDASIISPSDILCLDDSIRLEARSSSGNGFQWQKNKLDIPGATQDEYWVKTPGRYTVKVANGDCPRISEPINLRRFTPPGIYTEADTVNGLLPILPRWLWTNKLPKQKGETFIKDIAVGPNGSPYILSSSVRRGRVSDQITGFFPEGIFRVSLPEAPGSSIEEERFITADPDGNIIATTNSMYLTKYRPDGRIAWQLAEYRPKVSGVSVDPLGFIYTLGRFQDTLIFGDEVLVPASRGGLYLAKHAPDGELLWVENFAADWYKYDFGNAIHNDCEGNVYISGGFRMIANFGEKILRASLTGEDFFIAKFNPQGKIQWAKKINTDKTRVRTNDVFTDCEGNTFMAFNRNLWRFDANGIPRWEGQLKAPAGSLATLTRLHASEGDLYISGISDRGDFFVTKLNRLNKQVIIWQDKGAQLDEGAVPAITAGQEGQVFIGGISKGNDFPGAQLDLTSGSSAFFMKYGKPDINGQREAHSLCKGEEISLYTQRSAGLSYQWMRNGKAIPNATSSSLRVTSPGTYQVRAFADYCERISEPQQVTQCGDDPMANPPITASNQSGNIPTQQPTPTKKPDPIYQGPPIETDIQYSSNGEPTRIKNRKVKKQEQIVISNNQVKISLWDHAAEDQDTVSLNINGEWVLEEYGLKKRRKYLDITLRPGKNFIILYAHNLGAMPPNTATIMVDDGIEQQRLQLRSTLTNCGKLTVTVK